MASKRSQNVKSRNKHWLLNWREAGIFTGIVSAQKRSHPCSKSRQLNALSHTEVTSYFNSKPDIFTGAVKWQCTKHCNTNTDVKQKKDENEMINTTETEVSGLCLRRSIPCISERPCISEEWNQLTSTCKTASNLTDSITARQNVSRPKWPAHYITEWSLVLTAASLILFSKAKLNWVNCSGLTMK